MAEKKLPTESSRSPLINALEMFLRATTPLGYEEYYNPRSPLLGKELSVGYVSREDMLGNDVMVWSILEYFYEGQLDFAWDRMTWYQNDWKASMSIEAKLLDKLTSQEVRYTTQEHVYQHEVKPKKKGWFG